MVSPKYEWILRSAEPPPGDEDGDLVSHVLTLRGVPARVHARFLSPSYEDALHDPALLPDFPEAVERVLAARERGDVVALFGDYDVDGITASAVLQEVLHALGLRTHIALPHREREGYGVSVAAVRAMVPPATLLVTVDNGTSAHEAIAEARARGADVIVVDHHRVAGALPDALVINPARAENRYPFQGLSAVGLAFKLARVLFDRAGRRGEEKWLLDLVALGTLADRVPLVDENRSLVRWGVRVLRERRRLGLAALMAYARITQPSCDSDDVTFRIVPRLNAAGRLRDAQLAFSLLTTQDPAEAQKLAAELEGLNGDRRRLTERAVQEIKEALMRTVPLPDVLCVSGPWIPGILGVLAGRIAEELGRPAVVIHTGERACVASMRGDGSVHVVEMLSGIAPALTKFGGHANAAGFSFPRAALRDVERYFTSLALPSSGMDRPPLMLDCPLPPARIRADVARQLQALEPHGAGNERPVFLLEDAAIEEARAVGTAGGHQRLVVRPAAAPQTVWSAVAFRWGDRRVPERGTTIDLAVELRADAFRGAERVDLHVRDIRSHVPRERTRVAARLREAPLSARAV